MGFLHDSYILTAFNEWLCMSHNYLTLKLKWLAHNRSDIGIMNMLIGSVFVSDAAARQTPSPGDGGRGRGVRPGGKGPPPPEEPGFAGFKLKPVPLKFVKKIKDLFLKEAESVGSSAMFECEVSPSTAITSWMKDGNPIHEGPKYKFTSDGKDRKLNIVDVQPADNGEYTCIAKNAGKEIQCSAKLLVEGKLKGLFIYSFIYLFL